MASSLSRPPEIDPERWKRLRLEIPAAAMVLLALLSAFASTMAVIFILIPDKGSSVAPLRGCPLAWLIFAPLLWWIWSAGLLNYRPKALRIRRLLLVIYSLLAVCAATASCFSFTNLLPQPVFATPNIEIGFTTFAIICAFGSEIAFRKSSLAKPAKEILSGAREFDRGRRPLS